MYPSSQTTGAHERQPSDQSDQALHSSQRQQTPILASDHTHKPHPHSTNPYRGGQAVMHQNHINKAQIANPSNNNSIKPHHNYRQSSTNLGSASSKDSYDRYTNTTTLGPNSQPQVTNQHGACTSPHAPHPSHDQSTMRNMAPSTPGLVPGQHYDPLPWESSRNVTGNPYALPSTSPTSPQPAPSMFQSHLTGVGSTGGLPGFDHTHHMSHPVQLDPMLHFSNHHHHSGFTIQPMQLLNQPQLAQNASSLFTMDQMGASTNNTASLFLAPPPTHHQKHSESNSATKPHPAVALEHASTEKRANNRSTKVGLGNVRSRMKSNSSVGQGAVSSHRQNGTNSVKWIHSVSDKPEDERGAGIGASKSGPDGTLCANQIETNFKNRSDESGPNSSTGSAFALPSQGSSATTVSNSATDAEISPTSTTTSFLTQHSALASHSHSHSHSQTLSQCGSSSTAQTQTSPHQLPSHLDFYQKPLPSTDLPLDHIFTTTLRCHAFVPDSELIPGLPLSRPVKIAGDYHLLPPKDPYNTNTFNLHEVAQAWLLRKMKPTLSFFWNDETGSFHHIGQQPLTVRSLIDMRRFPLFGTPTGFPFGLFDQETMRQTIKNYLSVYQFDATLSEPQTVPYSISKQGLPGPNPDIYTASEHAISQRLFLGQIPPNVDCRSLYWILSSFGPIDELTFLRDRHFRSTGSAICLFNRSSSARAACRQLHQCVQFEGANFPLEVVISPPRLKGKTHALWDSNNPMSKVIMANIPPTVHPDTVLAQFRHYDPEAFPLTFQEQEDGNMFAIVAMKRLIATVFVQHHQSFAFARTDRPCVVSQTWDSVMFTTFVSEDNKRSANPKYNKFPNVVEDIDQVIPSQSLTLAHRWNPGLRYFRINRFSFTHFVPKGGDLSKVTLQSLFECKNDALNAIHQFYPSPAPNPSKERNPAQDYAALEAEHNEESLPHEVALIMVTKLQAQLEANPPQPRQSRYSKQHQSQNANGTGNGNANLANNASLGHNNQNNNQNLAQNGRGLVPNTSSLAPGSNPVIKGPHGMYMEQTGLQGQLHGHGGKMAQIQYSGTQQQQQQQQPQQHHFSSSLSITGSTQSQNDVPLNFAAITALYQEGRISREEYLRHAAVHQYNTTNNNQLAGKPNQQHQNLSAHQNQNQRDNGHNGNNQQQHHVKPLGSSQSFQHGNPSHYSHQSHQSHQQQQQQHQHQHQQRGVNGAKYQNTNHHNNSHNTNTNSSHHPNNSNNANNNNHNGFATNSQSQSQSQSRPHFNPKMSHSHHQSQQGSQQQPPHHQSDLNSNAAQFTPLQPPNSHSHGSHTSSHHHLSPTAAAPNSHSNSDYYAHGAQYSLNASGPQSHHPGHKQPVSAGDVGNRNGSYNMQSHPDRAVLMSAASGASNSANNTKLNINAPMFFTPFEPLEPPGSAHSASQLSPPSSFADNNNTNTNNSNNNNNNANVGPQPQQQSILATMTHLGSQSGPGAQYPFHNPHGYQHYPTPPPPIHSDLSQMDLPTPHNAYYTQHSPVSSVSLLRHGNGNGNGNGNGHQHQHQQPLHQPQGQFKPNASVQSNNNTNTNNNLTSHSLHPSSGGSSGSNTNIHNGGNGNGNRGNGGSAMNFSHPAALPHPNSQTFSPSSHSFNVLSSPHDPSFNRSSADRDDFSTSHSPGFYFHRLD